MVVPSTTRYRYSAAMGTLVCTDGEEMNFSCNKSFKIRQPFIFLFLPKTLCIKSKFFFKMILYNQIFWRNLIYVEILSHVKYYQRFLDGLLSLSYKHFHLVSSSFLFLSLDFVRYCAMGHCHYSLYYSDVFKPLVFSSWPREIVWLLKWIYKLLRLVSSSLLFLSLHKTDFFTFFGGKLR